MLLRPHRMNLVLDINLLHLDGPEFANDSEHPFSRSDQNPMRDARMQTYRAASASGGFANIDLNPKRPTTNRTAIKMTRRGTVPHKGVNQDAPQINITWGTHCFTQVGL